MTRDEQKELVRNFTQQVADALLSKADQWPEDWDGHDLRELVAYAFNHERTRLMREDRKRRRAAENEILVRNLY
jgi:uncharacterized iron-regulated protein